ncbi:hypothetical protein SKAU_G00068070 [Synaphobranchus kaupii]|uniref:Secreted protein n=1 Tax=Synaphobranchus kaupii TaxID=118154 RepID=A0A9Q1G7A1_SYNKA|nr:hypothetical protein SKAU_G00068070 [Synaphobranchus kaupii]
MMAWSTVLSTALWISRSISCQAGHMAHGVPAEGEAAQVRCQVGRHVGESGASGPIDSAVGQVGTCYPGPRLSAADLERAPVSRGAVVRGGARCFASASAFVIRKQDALCRGKPGVWPIRSHASLQRSSSHAAGLPDPRTLRI